VRCTRNDNPQANNQGNECERTEFSSTQGSEYEDGADHHQTVLSGESQQRFEVGRRHDDVELHMPGN